jgi:hypothetical protein
MIDVHTLTNQRLFQHPASIPPQLNFRLAVLVLATVELGKTGASAQTANVA